MADAKKEKIDADAAWEMISNAKTVLIGKGKKVLEFSPDADNREEILKVAMGRTGNLRAPTIRTGDKLMIGYNDDMYGGL
jgi:hypothetical protein